jgi:protein TonB
MFESTLSAQGLNESERRLGPLSAAVIGHLAIVFAVVAVTAFIVPPITTREPSELPPLVTILRPPNLGSPDPALQQQKKGTDGAKSKRAVVPQPPVEAPKPPAATPDRLMSEHEPPATEGPPGFDEGEPGLVDGTGRGSGERPGLTEGDPGGDGSDPVVVTGDMTKPALLVKVEPTYPDVARMARLSGRVTISAVIGLDGSVESAEVLASTSPLFSDTAIGAVRKWRYRPALMNGKPVRVYFTVVVDFSLR